MLTSKMPQASVARHGEPIVTEWIGVAIAAVSSLLGGSAAAITRYHRGPADPDHAFPSRILRWAFGFLCVLPAAILLGANGTAARPPGRSDAWAFALRVWFPRPL